MFKIFYYPKFNREYKKLFTAVQKAVDEIIGELRVDPFTNHLKTHKLHGKLDNLYSCRATYSYRIIFEIKSGQTILLRSVGDHSIYNEF